MEEEKIDLKKYWLLLKQWAWLLISGLVLGALAAFVASLLQTPIYQAITKVMITGGGMLDQSLDTYSYSYADQLTETYLQLFKTEPVSDSTSEQLGIDLEEVEIDASAISSTTIIEIEVEHSNPQTAALIANTLVQVLIEKSNEIQTSRYSQMEESLLAQKSQLETQIATIQSQIEQTSIKTIDEQEQWLQEQIDALETEANTLSNEIEALGTPTTLELSNELEAKEARLEVVEQLLPMYKDSYADLVVYGTQVDTVNTNSVANSQLVLLTSTQTLYQQIYQSVLSDLESVRLAGMENTPNVVQIEAATVPEEPVRPRILVNTILGGMVGLLLIAGILALRESLDNTIKTADDVEKLLGLNTIGYIVEMQNKEVDETGLYVLKQPRSSISEAFRCTRTNIEFSAIDKPIKTLLITSPEPETGKTTIASNLATIFAQGERRVLLLDADLRRPHMHRVMKLDNRVGLTDLLLDHHDIRAVSYPIGDNKFVSVITSGNLPPNPAELLGSAKMESTLGELATDTDVVIIDSPPLMIADAQVLATKVDAVLLVIRQGKTQKDTTKASIDLLKKTNARVIGVVLNRVTRDKGEYYKRFHYEDYNCGSQSEDELKANKKSTGKGKEEKPIRKPLLKREKKLGMNDK